MAPDEPNQKRKRGRPPGTSKNTEPASATGSKQQAPAPEPAPGKNIAHDAVPKKRGRPRKSVDPMMEEPAPPTVKESGEPAAAAPRKRGRPRKSVPMPEEEAPPAMEKSGESPAAAPRKRGRPRKSDAVAEEEASPIVKESGAPPAAAAVPRKRGRPRKSDLVVEEEAPPTSKENGEAAVITPRKRGRPRKSDAVTGEEAPPAPKESGEPATTAPRKRGRPPKVREHELDDRNPSESRPRKRTRPDVPEDVGDREQRGKASADASQQAAEQGTAETETRRSRRERQSADETANQVSPEGSRTDKAAPGHSQKPKRGRPPVAEVPEPKAQSKAGAPQTEKPGKKRGPGRPSIASNEDNQTKKPQPQQPRPSSEPAPPRAPQPLPPYRHLTTRTRQIPRATITSKWQPLDAPSITAIDTILTDASRAVLHRLRDRDTRHAQAQTILRTFSARLRAKLARGMPFPPPAVPAPSKVSSKGVVRGEHGVELDFERTVEAIRGLERALDPVLHSVALLRGEREREEAALEREYGVLRRLEANAKAQARGWREQGRREHVLVGGVEGKGGEGLEVVKKEVGGGEEGKGKESVFKDLEGEEELLGLAQQVGNHMESMRSNLGQIEGVLPAVAKSRAALQGVLCRYLDQEQYDQVVLG